MYKYSKLIKRQQRETTGSNMDSPASTASSQDHKAESGESSLVPDPVRSEHWEALDIEPSNPSLLSLWQQDLREIEWSQANDVWESCLYD